MSDDFVVDENVFNTAKGAAVHSIASALKTIPAVITNSVQVTFQWLPANISR